MAQRPVFCPQETGAFVREQLVAFTWHAGFAVSQAQKSIRSLHEEAARQDIQPVLEVSSKSPEPLGVRLSAFNLQIDSGEHGWISVESAYQGSKVFEGDKQFTDLYSKSAREAKTDPRIRSSGNLIAFRFGGEEWPLNPTTAFYDWLYINALEQNPNLSSDLAGYAGFTDIAFNPDRSFNCQARAAALFVALQQRDKLKEALFDRDAYLAILASQDQPTAERAPTQETLL